VGGRCHRRDRLVPEVSPAAPLRRAAAARLPAAAGRAGGGGLGSLPPPLPLASHAPRPVRQEPRSHGERLTLLVNVWVGHRPLGLPTAPSEALLRLLRCVPAHSGQVLALDATTPRNRLDVPPARHVGRSSGERLAAPVMGGRAKLRFALPKPSTAAEGRGVVTWKDVGVRLEVAQR